MTNMFLDIPAENLCDQHLLGLHKELHQEAGTLENHPHGEAIVNGHYRLGQVDTTKLVERHSEVAQEMVRRGMNHDSALNYEDSTGLLVSGFPVQAVNKISLSNRCENCEVQSL